MISPTFESSRVHPAVERYRTPVSVYTGTLRRGGDAVLEGEHRKEGPSVMNDTREVLI